MAFSAKAKIPFDESCYDTTQHAVGTGKSRELLCDRVLKSNN